MVKTEGASTEELGELRTLTRMSGDLGSCRIYGHILVNKVGTMGCVCGGFPAK